MSAYRGRPVRTTLPGPDPADHGRAGPVRADPLPPGRGSLNSYYVNMFSVKYGLFHKMSAGDGLPRAAGTMAGADRVTGAPGGLPGPHPPAGVTPSNTPQDKKGLLMAEKFLEKQKGSSQ